MSGLVALTAPLQRKGLFWGIAKIGSDAPIYPIEVNAIATAVSKKANRGPRRTRRGMRARWQAFGTLPETPQTAAIPPQITSRRWPFWQSRAEGWILSLCFTPM